MSDYVYSPHINVRSITFFENLDAQGNGTGTPAARLSLSGGVLTLQAWGDLEINIQGSAQVKVQQNASMQVTGNCTATIGGHQTTQVEGLQSTEAGDYLLRSKGDATTRVDGDRAEIVGGSSLEQTSGLHRIEAPRIERHATEHLKDDAGGVGHTYMPDQVHTWMPWQGAGDCPRPPEHPLTASNHWCWPDGDVIDDAEAGVTGANDGH